jgi:hypothetical protein
VAAAAVVLGGFLDSEEFWASAGSVFFLACAAIISYAAKGLGVAAEMADLLRAHAGANGVSVAAETPKPTETSTTSDDFVSLGARSLTQEEEEWLQRSVTRRGDKPISPDEVAPIMKFLRRTNPPREQSDREWVRQNTQPAKPDSAAASNADVAWLLEHVSMDSTVMDLFGDAALPPGWSSAGGKPES